VTTPATAPTAEPGWELPVPDRLPAAAWALAVSSVLAQVVTFLDDGVRTGGFDVVVSMLIGALVIWWFAAGVLSARTVRLVITWVLLVLGAVVELVTVIDVGPPGQGGLPLLRLATSLAMLGSLMWFSTTPYYFWQRSRPRVSGPSRAGILAVAVLVGLSAGLVHVDDGASVDVQLGAGG
jgi:hypothetical protein